MKKIFLSLAVVALFSSYLWAEKGTKVDVTISYIEGDVEVILAGAKDWLKAKLYGKLKEGDRIRTKLQSNVELKLADGSTINITENSIMDIKELFEKGLTTKSSFKVWMGGVKARFKRLKTRDSEAKFYTPTAVMGLRGTTVWLTVDWEGKTRCGFEEGNGYIYSDKDGEKAVNEGEEANVSLEGDITIISLQMKIVPDVVGKSLDDAKTDIISAGLKVGEIRAEESTKPKDEVLSQYPVAGSEVLANTSVSLVIAIDIPPCVVPDVIGLLKPEAIAKINETGLTLGMVIEKTSDRPKDEVLMQRPNPGTEVKKESLVDIAISKGPPPKVIVPNLIGKTLDEARAILEGGALRLSGIILKKESIIIEEGRIVEQNPNAGDSVDVGSFIQVWIASLPLAEKPPVPNIHSRFTIPGLFVREIPYLILHITPADKKLAPLYLSVMGRLTRFDAPPYLLNLKPPVLSIGVNNIDVSAWFEGGDKKDEVIETPYYDPIAPRILSVKEKKIAENVVRIIVTIEDRESGIKDVTIGGVNATITEDYTQQERRGRTVYIRGTYEKTLNMPKNLTTIPIIIEVEDNAENKRTRTERIPDSPPYPKN